MARYKTRSETRRESVIMKYVKMRQAMGEIREVVGLGDRATLEDIIEAVKGLAAKNGEGKDKGTEP